MLTHAEETSLIFQASDMETVFTGIYNRYFTRVYNYVRYRVDDAGAVEDLTSEIFEKVFAGLKYYRPEKAPFSAWLFSIARHSVTDYYRRRARISLASLETSAELPCADSSPDGKVIADELQQHIHRALAALGEQEREIIALKFWSGLTNRDIAGVTGLRESNVGVILFRSMRRLRLVLESQGLSSSDGN